MIRISVFLALFIVLMSSINLGDAVKETNEAKFNITVERDTSVPKDEYEAVLQEYHNEQAAQYEYVWSHYGFPCMDDNVCPED